MKFLQNFPTNKISFHFLIIILLIYKNNGLKLLDDNLNHSINICDEYNNRKIYLEYSESGILTAANIKYNFPNNQNPKQQLRCSIQFLTCPSCVVEVKFLFLNIPRNCGRTSSVYETCACDYVWIYEPPYQQVSGQQFCGLQNSSSVFYKSQTRNIAITFIYSKDYENAAFALQFSSKRNRIEINGKPKLFDASNSSRDIISPFFPNRYPDDLVIEYEVKCQSTSAKCRINLIFSDFLIASNSIIEFFDDDGQRMHVSLGTAFRPPILITSGPSLKIRFYANGADGYGFRAHFTYILGEIEETAFKPDIDCGGYVNNLGGAITMMDMVEKGTKYYDCIWLVKPSEAFLHLKTHLYVKLVTFSNFVGNSELTIRQGLTSKEPTIESVRLPVPHFVDVEHKEHVVPVSQGFYITFRGYFKPESKLAIAYAGFSYRDCYAGSDFPCHNLRCISIILNCDGFDHCGDRSDELANCSEGINNLRMRPEWNKVPNFIFPKINQYSDLTAATLIFLTCSFCLIGIILAMALLLYRVNLRARHQRNIQDQIETIHAILEESVEEIEEDVILPDDPPDYEPPPNYADVIRSEKAIKAIIKKIASKRYQSSCANQNDASTTSIGCQTTHAQIPQSPPPIYQLMQSSVAGPSTDPNDSNEKWANFLEANIRKSFRKYASWKLLRNQSSQSEEHLIKCFSDSQLIRSNFESVVGRNGNRSLIVADENAFICWPKFQLIKNKLYKSFSTDDITLL